MKAEKLAIALAGLAVFFKRSALTYRQSLVVIIGRICGS